MPLQRGGSGGRIVALITQIFDANVLVVHVSLQRGHRGGGVVTLVTRVANPRMFKALMSEYFYEMVPQNPVHTREKKNSPII